MATASHALAVPAPVMEKKITDISNSALNMQALFTMDNTLEGAEGLVKRVYKYTYTGYVEKLTKGAKNSNKSLVGLSYKDYTVERYQQMFDYNDQDAMVDPKVLDVLVDGAGKAMANEVRSEYFTELGKISNIASLGTSAFSYDVIVDAVAGLDKAGEQDIEGLFVVGGSKFRKDIRKDSNFKAAHQGDILFTGQFGDIAGIPVIYSNLCGDDEAFICNKETITFFVKKSGTVEQDRDIESKDNWVVYERYGVVALTNDTRACQLLKGKTFTNQDGGSYSSTATYYVLSNGLYREIAVNAAYFADHDDELYIMS